MTVRPPTTPHPTPGMLSACCCCGDCKPKSLMMLRGDGSHSAIGPAIARGLLEGQPRTSRSTMPKEPFSPFFSPNPARGSAPSPPSVPHQPQESISAEMKGLWGCPPPTAVGLRVFLGGEERGDGKQRLQPGGPAVHPHSAAPPPAPTFLLRGTFWRRSFLPDPSRGVQPGPGISQPPPSPRRCPPSR